MLVQQDGMDGYSTYRVHVHAHTPVSSMCMVGPCWLSDCVCAASAAHTPHTAETAVTWGGGRRRWEAALIIIQRQTKLDKRPLFLPLLPLSFSLSLSGPIQWSSSSARRSAPPLSSSSSHLHLHLWDKTLALDFQQQLQWCWHTLTVGAQSEGEKPRDAQHPVDFFFLYLFCIQASVFLHASPRLASLTHRPGVEFTPRRRNKMWNRTVAAVLVIFNLCGESLAGFPNQINIGKFKAAHTGHVLWIMKVFFCPSLCCFFL